MDTDCEAIEAIKITQEALVAELVHTRRQLAEARSFLKSELGIIYRDGKYVRDE